MSLKGHSSIFESPSQRMDHIDPKSIRLLSDRALIRDLGDPETSGSIIIPETCQESRAQQEWGNLRIGLVLAVGPGDKWLETWVADDGSVGRKQIMRTCALCEGQKTVNFSIKEYKIVAGGEFCPCPDCEGVGKMPVCTPPQCKPGDTVLYSRRREAEFWVNGERLTLCNSEQSVVAVLED